MSLKTEDEWLKFTDGKWEFSHWRYDRIPFMELVRAIQADALRHAAEIAKSERVKESGHAEDKAYNMAIKHVSEAILSEADKLKTK